MLSKKYLRHKTDEMVKVAVRCRPMDERELSLSFVNVVKVYPLRNIVELYDPKYNKMNCCKEFKFDKAYDSNCTQEEVYNQTVRPLVNSVLDGFNCTVFAYGQSGSGKTYTMDGYSNTENATGIISKSFEHIFDHISHSCNMQYLVRISYLEIYQDEIRDLLNKENIEKYELRENKVLGVYVKNLRSFVCKSVKQMNTLIDVGRQNRTVGYTNLNEMSSRSHAIVTITIEMRDVEGPLEGRVRVGKFNLVDLAGSERQNKTNSQGERLKEASKINLSLTALGNVISALADNREQYIPYRDSKLTRLLKDSLGGNSKTIMIANIGPASYNYDETLNTLRYASRARNIKNEPKINEDPKDTLLKKYKDEIERLKLQLAARTQKFKRSKNERDISHLHAENFKLKQSNEIKGFKTGVDNSQRNNDIKQAKNTEELAKRIESLESRLLTGTKSILEHTYEQQKFLDAQSNKIRKVIKREEEMQELLELQEETNEEIREEYVNLQQEVEMKSKKLLRMHRELQNVKDEIRDVMEEFNNDRRDLEITEHELLKDLKLRLLIMENFIPNEDRRNILSRLYFDDELDAWKVISEREPTEVLPKLKCAYLSRRPVTSYTVFTRRKADHIFKCNQTQENRENMFRFKGENILELELIETLQTTKDYHPPKIPPLLNSVFQSALKPEDNIHIEAASLFFNIYQPTQRPGLREINHELRCKQLTKTSEEAPVYPKTRGLVRK